MRANCNRKLQRRVKSCESVLLRRAGIGYRFSQAAFGGGGGWYDSSFFSALIYD